MKSRVNNITTKMLSYFRRRGTIDYRRVRTMELVWERSAKESADFISDNLNDAVLFDDRKFLWEHSLSEMPDDGVVMECGVFQGDSINFIADWMVTCGDDRIVHGFDSFEGLEEDWAGENLRKGYFDLKGKLPVVRPTVRLYKGWVQDTISPFLSEMEVKDIALLHIDTDTYTPASYILKTLKPYLGSGAIIIFDELMGYPNWRAHEYKALYEEFDLSEFDFIGFTNRQAAIRIR